MKYHETDGNLAALARYEAKMDADARDDELYEMGAAEKPLADSQAASNEEGIVEVALTELKKSDKFIYSFFLNLPEAITMLEEELLKQSKEYDREQPR
jgi:hypothetical protein